jgi:transaldolase
MSDNPLQQLRALGQSPWFDYIRRELITSGELARLIESSALGGITSNPSIFEEAITRHHDYDAAIAARLREPVTAEQLYHALVVEDVSLAAAAFLPLYRQTAAADGYVSLEVSPHLADDSATTLQQARQLWHEIDAPNLMIKVPATQAGLPAIRQLIAEGINVNVTLLFGLERYRAVLDAFTAGLEQRQQQGLPLTGVASVASFFISRIDTLIDPQLDRLAVNDPQATQWRGESAIALARLAYRHYQQWRNSPRWQRLAAAGAQPQRLLWASTSTKDPAYADTKYVEALIGPETVNTLPPATLAAYRDHGQPAVRIDQDEPPAQALVAALTRLGIDLEQVAAATGAGGRAQVRRGPRPPAGGTGGALRRVMMFSAIGARYEASHCWPSRVGSKDGPEHPTCCWSFHQNFASSLAAPFHTWMCCQAFHGVWLAR